MLNNYFDIKHPLHPYSYSLKATKGTITPTNALRDTVPPLKKVGYFPCEKDGKWIDIEDHRGEVGYVNNVPFTIVELGEYPNGWTKDISQLIPVVVKDYDNRVEQRLNDWAVKHQYVSAERLLSCYENSTVPKWKFEAGNFRILWDSTWLWLQNYLNTKLAEAKPSIPTWEELEALLDENVPLVWPEYNG